MHRGSTDFLTNAVSVFSEYHLDLKKIEVTYPVRRQGGEVDELKVKYSEDDNIMRDSLDTLYTYVHLC